MEQLTPERIQQARELAREWVDHSDGECPAAYDLGVAVLALTEQQPEPVSIDELHAHLYGKSNRDRARNLLRQFNVTRKAGA